MKVVVINIYVHINNEKFLQPASYIKIDGGVQSIQLPPPFSVFVLNRENILNSLSTGVLLVKINSLYLVVSLTKAPN